jgi:16S rRNA (guanine527-N7)-methyltransferase
LSTRFPPSRFATPKPVPKPKQDNAMWRIPEWFNRLSPEVCENLKGYHSELLKFTKKINLISMATVRESDKVHLGDCILAAEIILRQPLGRKVFDIGSGNGLPGLILALLDPSREYVLVESDERKCEFMKHSAHILKLRNVIVSNSRIEDLVGLDMESAVSRGFASITKTLLICNRLFKEGGVFYHLKGSNWSGEVSDIPSQVFSSWKPDLVAEYSLPASGIRRAVVSTQKL